MVIIITNSRKLGKIRSIASLKVGTFFLTCKQTKTNWLAKQGKNHMELKYLMSASRRQKGLFLLTIVAFSLRAGFTGVFMTLSFKAMEQNDQLSGWQQSPRVIATNSSELRAQMSSYELAGKHGPSDYLGQLYNLENTKNTEGRRVSWAFKTSLLPLLWVELSL